MRLERLVSFNSKKNPIIPEEYRAQFPYIITILNTSLRAFDDTSYHIKQPDVEDFIEAAGFVKDDYLIFGESDGWGWSDAGCNFLYAVALRRPFEMDYHFAVDTMWRNWLLKNRMRYKMVLSSLYGRLYIQKSDSDEEICLHGYCDTPLFDRFVINVIKNGETYYECYDHGTTATLNRQQMIGWLSHRSVINARIDKKPLKNGEPRIVVTPITSMYASNKKLSSIAR